MKLVAKSFWKRLIFESQVMSSYLIHYSCCQKLKQSARSLFPQKFVANIFSKFKLCVNSLFSDLNPSTKEIFIFHNPFNYVIEELPHNLHLEVIYLQCDGILQGTYQEKNLMWFYKFLPSDTYTQNYLLLYW